GRTLAFVGDLARRLSAAVQGGRTVAPEAPGGKATNRAPVFGPDGAMLCEYRKIHPFSFGREPERFEGGSEVMTYAWLGTPTVPGGQAAPDASSASDSDQEAPGPDAGLTICPAICYDLR